MNSSLIDNHGRKIRKLRISLLDACNFRCFYCMPIDAKFMQPAKWLTGEQIETICRVLTNHGIEQVRVTGGEPTLRRDFRDIMTRLTKLPIKKVGLTTNGMLLSKHLDFLKATNCMHINISLDSLREERFNTITRTQSFDNVYKSIIQAREMEFNLKLNVVLMKGINDDEIIDFVKFSETSGIEVRFLEVMRIGQACNPQNDMFISANDCIKIIKNHYELNPVQMEMDATSFNFLTPKGAQIGFIASESQPFCGSCSRWRLSADGFLRACLMSQNGINIRDISIDEYPSFFSKLLAMKPTGRIKEIEQDMNQIGG
tara:strand:- start:203 stop:1147 length:945 start_codon:yes stop_codon:yes gene_type:complete